MSEEMNGHEIYYNNLHIVYLIKSSLLRGSVIESGNFATTYIILGMLYEYMHSNDELVNKIIFNTKIEKYCVIVDNEDYDSSFKILNNYKNYIDIIYSDDCVKKLPLPKKINEKFLHYCANNDIVEIKKLLKKKIDKKFYFLKKKIIF